MELKNWVLPDVEIDLVDKICNELGISKLLARLLITRGFTEYQEIYKFLNGTIEFSDPESFVGMKDLIVRVEKALENFEKICIFSDYDADGITSTAMIYSYLLERGADLTYLLPSRYADGYGLSKNVVRKIADYGVDLIFTVDNGVSAVEEIEFAKKEFGIDVVVTDHHRPPEKLPEAVAIVNPHLNPDGFKDFAGVGVVFKVIEALERGKKSRSELIEKYGDFLAIGTIADSVPLRDENRELVKLGLKAIETTIKPGVRVFLENCGICEEVTSTDVSFKIAPKINACGRMGNPEAAAKLLLSESNSEAEELFNFLMNENIARKNASNQVLEDVKRKIIEMGVQFDRIIFVWSDSWNHGVLGIIAAHISSKFGRPCFLIAVDGLEAHASGRSIDGFDIHAACKNCSKYLDRFGGHPMASGSNLKTENLQNFKSELLKYAREIEMPFPILKIDCMLELEEISIESFEDFSVFKPFGTENLEPIFAITNTKLIKISPISNGRHLRLKFSKNNRIFDTVLFGVSKKEFFYVPGDELDIAFRLRKNMFLGTANINLHILEIKFSFLDTLKALKQKRIFENFMSDEKIEDIIQFIPSRDEIASVYLFLKKRLILCFRVDILCFRMKNENINLTKLYL
ncbi:MAG: single-stranded-DNA-specific exonuclease RecJ, partial [Oscillospiraceae bacterium]|nr:single-stranded-DNA-specific exonuclease RecJ [Oscillospiraceae bacterium]